MKAREWLERGKQAADQIEAFSNFWRGFNNLFSAIGNGQERDKIRLFLSRRLSEAQAKEILESNAAGVAYLLSQPVVDMRGNGRDTTSYIEAFKATTDSLIKLQELFMVIYQVRCNLEHGEKSPRVERDVLLCESAAPLVAYVVDQNA